MIENTAQKMRVPDIEMTSEELEILQKINFDWVSNDDLEGSIEPMGNLTLLLTDRKAIPEIRLKYFSDPDYRVGGRGKSWQDAFEQSGDDEGDICFNPGFLKFLKYFIFGPELPSEIKKVVKDAVANGKHLSRSDASDALPKIKEVVKRDALDAHTVGVEVFKLAIECGAIASTAAWMQDSIQKIRPSTRQS